MSIAHHIVNLETECTEALQAALKDPGLPDYAHEQLIRELAKRLPVEEGPEIHVEEVEEEGRTVVNSREEYFEKANIELYASLEASQKEVESLKQSLELLNKEHDALVLVCAPPHPDAKEEVKP
jgi:hypothetical protein